MLIVLLLARTLQAFLIKQVRSLLSQQPGATIISVSQNDAGNAKMCRTPAEMQVVDAEGSFAGPLLRCVNAIADAIKDDYPNVLVDTLAYENTAFPPRLTKPRANVVIRLSTGGGSAVPWESQFINRTAMPFPAQLEGWGKLVADTRSRLYLWTYGAFDQSDFLACCLKSADTLSRVLS